MPKSRAKKAATAYSARATVVISLAFGCTGVRCVASSTASSGNPIVARLTKS